MPPKYPNYEREMRERVMHRVKYFQQFATNVARLSRDTDTFAASHANLVQNDIYFD